MKGGAGMKNEDYAYAVARIRANERKLLTNADIESLLRCRSFDDAVKFLFQRNGLKRTVNALTSERLLRKIKKSFGL